MILEPNKWKKDVWFALYQITDLTWNQEMSIPSIIINFLLLSLYLYTSSFKRCFPVKLTVIY